MKDRVQFISVSTDPEHNVPEVLRGFGPVHGLSDSNWVLLTTTADQSADATRQLVQAYGHKFTRAGDDRLRTVWSRM